MRYLIAIVALGSSLALLPKSDDVAIKPYAPGWRTHESQSRGISEEYASRWDRNLHTRVCEAQ